MKDLRKLDINNLSLDHRIELVVTFHRSPCTTTKYKLMLLSLLQSSGRNFGGGHNVKCKKLIKELHSFNYENM